MLLQRARHWACVNLCAWLCGAWLSTAAWGADAPTEPAGALTLGAAIQAALQGNPGLAVSEFTLKSGDARITQAGLRLNPQLSLELEDFAGTGAASGVHALQTTLSLSQIVELGDKRRLRTAAAQAGRDLGDVERQAQQLDVLAEVSRQFVAVIEAQEKLELARRSVELAENSLQAIDVRVQAARAPEAERSRARVALARARIESEYSATALNAARHSLAALWGSKAPAFTSATAQLFEFPPVADFGTLAQRLDANPDFIRFASEARVREAELRLAQAQARANLSLSMGVRRRELEDDAALVAGFSMPLAVFDRNQGAIREAQIRREQTAALRNASQVKAEAALYALYQELGASRSRADALRNEALPQAQQALAQTQYGFERGRFSYLELTEAQRELIELQRAAIEAAAETHRLLIEIERLTAEPLAIAR